MLSSVTAEQATPRGKRTRPAPVRINTPDRQISLLLAVLALALYLRTMAPGLLPGDAGEFQVAAWRLGLAHATGYPLYLSIGYLWQHLWFLVGVVPATSLNALSALFGATAVGLLYLLLVDWLRTNDTTAMTGVSGLAPVKRGAAALATLLFATNFTFWSQSLIAEVYTLHALFVILLLRLVGPTPEPPKTLKPEQDIASHVPSHVCSDPSSASQGHPVAGRFSQRRLVGLAAVAGCALTHHATILLLLPVLLLYIHIRDRGWYRQPVRVWLAMLLALLVPLLFYLYIPLRSGPAASPWYHQPLGETVLKLYDGDFQAFVDFVSGQSIAVGFHTLSQAWSGLPQAGWLWWYHFRWPGLLLVGLGLATLVRYRKTDILLLTIGYLLVHQVFNLFYAIGDILVYYIPLYLVGTIWLAYGVDSIATGAWLPAQNRHRWRPAVGMVMIVCLFLLPLRTIPTTAAQLDQSEAVTARRTWENILASAPPENAILVSNDRNDMPPLFYIQYVEGRYQEMTALFPKIAPEDRFADIGSTVATALAVGDERPIYLVKEMPGLEVRFNIEAMPPLYQVRSAVQPHFEHRVYAAMGPLTLLGYNWSRSNKQIEIDLVWRVEDTMENDYTTTVQLFAAGEKIGQNDQPAGKQFYPTSLWKRGELLHESHFVTISALTPATVVDTLLIGMYRSERDIIPLAPFLTISLPSAPESISKATPDMLQSD